MGDWPEHSRQWRSDDVTNASSFRFETASEQDRQHAIAIEQLVGRYTDAVNHRDWESVADAWAHGGEWDLGPPVNVRKIGRDAIMEEVRHTVESMQFFFQMPHAFAILDLKDGKARSRVSLHEIAKMDPDAGVMGDLEGMSIHASYLDDLILDEDRHWRFAKRRYTVHLFADNGPAGEVIGG